MTQIYKIKAIACAMLTVATGLSALTLTWFIIFSTWPAVIGFVIMLVFQLVLMLFFLGNMTIARVHADIKAVGKQDS